MWYSLRRVDGCNKGRCRTTNALEDTFVRLHRTFGWGYGYNNTIRGGLTGFSRLLQKRPVLLYHFLVFLPLFSGRSFSLLVRLFSFHWFIRMGDRDFTSSDWSVHLSSRLCTVRLFSFLFFFSVHQRVYPLYCLFLFRRKGWSSGRNETKSLFHMVLG